MDPLESQSFIVKIWLEESEEETGAVLWRGHITHVPSEERRYLRTLNDIAEFIGPYLERLGSSAGLLSRARPVISAPD